VASASAKSGRHLKRVEDLAVAANAQVCVGDCNGNQIVTVAELIRSVNIALGNQALSTCSAIDANGNGLVAINELIQGVNNALDGCPGAPTPPPPATYTPTPPTPLPTATRTRTPTLSGPTPTPTLSNALAQLTIQVSNPSDGLCFRNVCQWRSGRCSP
jgi:hypothetical protein